MKILVDGKAFEIQKKGGVTNYTKSIAEYLSVANDVYFTTTLQNLDFQSNRTNVVKYNRFFLKPGRLFYWLEQYYFELYTSIKSIDVVHLPYYLNLFRNRVYEIKKPIVLTIHDLIKEKYPEYFSISSEEMSYRRCLIDKASAIICDSHNTKSDLLRYYPSISSSKVSVVYLATNIHKFLKPNCKKNLPDTTNKNYFLFVGGRKRYKNFELCLQALKILSEDLDLIYLKVVGSPFDLDEQRLIYSLGLEEKVHNCGYLDDSHLAICYRDSISLIYPSHYEGFGLPPLEAMACGACVIASNTASVPEVVQNAGLLLSDISVDGLVEKMREVYINHELRNDLIMKGYRRSKDFSWPISCQRILDVYKSVLE